eukprot:6241351-Alexandrium_andersonii.AAC.1
MPLPTSLNIGWGKSVPKEAKVKRLRAVSNSPAERMPLLTWNARECLRLFTPIVLGGMATAMRQT